MPHDLTLTGHGITLAPLTAAHAAPLVALLDDALWAGMSVPTPRTPDEMAAWVAAADATPGTTAFVVLGDDGTVRGSTSFYARDERVRRVEIGSTFYGRPWWGGPTNPAAKLLLLTHAFEVWGCERVALRADARNARSIAAIQRLGARPEGVLRRFRWAADGTLADVAYFSMLPDEWPAAKAALEERLPA